MDDTELQLWLWLKACEARKPHRKVRETLADGDKVVRVLQCEAREGGEADEGDD